MTNRLKFSVLHKIAFICVMQLFAISVVYADFSSEEVCALTGEDKQQFLAFDTQLRSALTKQDAVALSLLVQFPISVCTGSCILLTNAMALQERFNEYFSAAVREKILGTKMSELICRSDGIGYSSGYLWAGQFFIGDKNKGWWEYRINNVNIPRTVGKNAENTSSAFVCHTEKHLIVVDEPSHERLRYRAWNKPHVYTDKPDMEISGGSRWGEGTTPCQTYGAKFLRGTIEYLVVEKLGACIDQEEPPDAIGSVEVFMEGVLKAKWWCF